MTGERLVTLPFCPRAWQRPLLEDRAPRIVAVVHRRAGKSTALLWRGLRGAITSTRVLPRCVHILPYSVMWKRTGLWDQAMRAAESIPGAVIRKDDLSIRLPNGGTWQAGGADNQDTWRGGYADECIIDEFDDSPPTMVALVIEPMLADRGGTLVRSGTPKGRGLLQAAYEKAKYTAGYSAYLLDYRKTQALSEEAISTLRSEMSEEEFAQELECSFSAPNSGSYYGSALMEAELDGRVTSVPIDPLLRVITGWDLGVDGATAVWCMQVGAGGQWRVIDYVEGSREGLEWYVRWLQSKPYVYERHMLPHDVEVQELGTGRTRRETLRGLGVRPIRTVASPRGALADGINAVRMVLPRCWFDAYRCAAGIRALRNYRREWHEAGQTWRSQPVKDWASHGADAFRTLAMGVSERREEVRRGFSSPAALELLGDGGTGWMGH
jgi:phage terminase large subunit